MAGVNKVIIVGNLGNAPEMKTMPNGDAVTNMSIATSESWKDKNTGENKEVTEWHRCVLYKRLAEVAGEYLSKGSKVYIEGKLKTRKWQAQDGSDRYSTEIIVNSLQMLDTKQGNQQQSNNQPMQNQQHQAQNQMQQRPQTEPNGFNEDMIPF